MLGKVSLSALFASLRLNGAGFNGRVPVNPQPRRIEAKPRLDAGIGTWSGGCQDPNSALWKGRKPRSPSPRPSPQRRGRTIGRGATNRSLQTSRPTTARAPSLGGVGWGEGERGRRTDAAAQNVFGPRETEPQFLAALGRWSALRSDLNSYPALRPGLANAPVSNQAAPAGR